MGSIKLGGAESAHLTGDDGVTRRTMTVGAGTHPFDLMVRMGSATVVAA